MAFLYRLNNRSLLRIFVQCSLCFVFFMLGSYLNKPESGCIHKLDPNHKQHPGTDLVYQKLTGFTHI
jgi:hypothetical protein